MAFSETLIMPDFHLSETQATQITMALLSLSDKPVPERLVVNELQQRSYRPFGEFGKVFQQYQCLDCHQIGGDGSTIGPDLSGAGSKLRRDWLVSYLTDPYPIRPLVIEQMPMLGISEAEARAVAGYFDRYLTSDMVPDDIFVAGPPPQALVEEGEELFHEEYGCDACHVVKGKGGVYAPSLNDAGRRLKSGWVYALLRHPHTIDPHSIIPDFGIPPQHAKALTAFIVGQVAPNDALRASVYKLSRLEEHAIPEEVKGARRYNAKKGRSVYFRYCVFCHGAEGDGQGPNAFSLKTALTDFTDVKTMATLFNDDLIAAIRDGGKGVGKSVQMPPYGRTLSTSEIRQVVTYIRTFIPQVHLVNERKEIMAARGSGSSPKSAVDTNRD
jgi:mono/diheme cytochrome c family protein